MLTFFRRLLLLFTLSSCIGFATISATKHQQHPLCHGNERSALLRFKHSFSVNYSSTIDAHIDGQLDPSSVYPKMSSWNNSTDGDDCCRWDGVECDRDTGHVIALDLSVGCLYGSIDSSSTLFQLLHLRRLNLAYNYFNHSHIPSQIGHLSRLTHLNLSCTSFSGPIPSQIPELSNLVSLSFFGNPQLWLPHNLGLGGLVRNLTSIQKLDLSEVNISSTVPDSFANLSSLTALSLQRCGLHGQFPANIFNLPNLRQLLLSLNPNLTGFLPEFNASSPLRMLLLSDMSFSGGIPNSIGNLHSLEWLTITRCDFRGSIPHSIGNLQSLQVLTISECNLLGSIPESLSNLTQLTKLWFSYNTFAQGNFPPGIGKLHQLQFLDLTSTNVIGEIPPSLANLTRLYFSGFGSNKLMGRIPPELGNLTRLENLDVHDNALQGPVPISTFQLVNLEFLDVSSNSLSGTVESDKLVNLKNLKSLQLSYNELWFLDNTNILNATFPNFTSLGLASCNLSGFPNFLRGQSQLQVLDLEGNNIRGQIPKWIWNLSKKTLLSLDLGYNSLTGFEQSSIFLPFEKLLVLILRSNKLQGPLPIPPPSIILYQVSNNSFGGNLSPMLVNLVNLQVLDASNNNLGGTIPDSFKSESHLRTINLSRNNLGGRLPRSLANCKMLEILDIGNNEINDTFPAWLGVLPKLHILVLPFNQFHGTIGNFEARVEGDQYFSNWNGMKSSHNNFTYLSSSIITNDFLSTHMNWTHSFSTRDSMMVNYKGMEISYANIPGIFTMIDISNNRFEGPISESIGDLIGLKLLNLSNNGIIGSIPPSLGKLVDLESLDLSHNNLSGQIPKELTQLTFLAFFNVSCNNLSGSIPYGKQFNTFPNSSYMGNRRLCGNPLSSKCGMLQNLPNTDIGEEDSINATEIDWIVLSMGFVGGLVVGLIVGTKLTTQKHEWFLNIFGSMPLREKSLN